MAELDLDLRIALGNPCQKIADPEHGRFEHRADDELAGGLATQGLGGVAELLHGADDALCVRQQPAARGRQRHAGGGPLKKAHAEVLLEGLDLAR